jgi:hypothetical protein
LTSVGVIVGVVGVVVDCAVFASAFFAAAAVLPLRRNDG